MPTRMGSGQLSQWGIGSRITRIVKKYTHSCSLTRGRNEEYLETRVYLGVSPSIEDLVRVETDHLVIPATVHAQLPAVSAAGGPVSVRLGDFLHTSLKEPFAPPFGSPDFEPGREVLAFTFVAGCENVELAVLAESRAMPDLDAWYLRSSRALALYPTTHGMLEARKRRWGEVLKKLLKHEHESPKTMCRHLTYASELGLGKEREPIAVNGIRCIPAMLLEDLALLYPES